MSERLAFSMAMDLMFNGQNMDYSERPLSLDIIDTMAMFSDLPERAHIGVVGPGGGRLVKTLANVDSSWMHTRAGPNVQTIWNPCFKRTVRYEFTP